MKETITVIFSNQEIQKEMDIEIPLYITADELIRSLNQALQLGINVNDIERCYFRTENPITLLRGDKLLKEFPLHTGTKICFEKRNTLSIE